MFNFRLNFMTTLFQNMKKRNVVEIDDTLPSPQSSFDANHEIDKNDGLLKDHSVNVKRNWR